MRDFVCFKESNKLPAPSTITIVTTTTYPTTHLDTNNILLAAEKLLSCSLHTGSSRVSGSSIPCSMLGIGICMKHVSRWRLLMLHAFRDKWLLYLFRDVVEIVSVVKEAKTISPHRILLHPCLLLLTKNFHKYYTLSIWCKCSVA